MRAAATIFVITLLQLLIALVVTSGWIQMAGVFAAGISFGLVIAILFNEFI